MISIEEEMRKSRQAAEEMIGGEYVPRSTEEYIQMQRDAARKNVHKRSQTENFHVRPRLGGLDMNGNQRYGWACLYSATGLYGKPYRIAGNQQFASSPEQFGFKRVSASEVQPGDIVQYGVYDGQGNYWPSHGMIYDSDDNGIPRFNYSKGYTNVEDGDPKAIVHGGRYADEPLSDKGSYRVYRFVGTPEDEIRWAQEYMSKYPVQKIPATPLDAPGQGHYKIEKR